MRKCTMSVSLSKRAEQILAATADGAKGLAVDAGGKFLRLRAVNDARPVRPQIAYAAADERLAQAARDHFNFRQFGHESG